MVKGKIPGISLLFDMYGGTVHLPERILNLLLLRKNRIVAVKVPQLRNRSDRDIESSVTYAIVVQTCLYDLRQRSGNLHPVRIPVIDRIQLTLFTRPAEDMLYLITD